MLCAPLSRALHMHAGLFLTFAALQSWRYQWCYVYSSGIHDPLSPACPHLRHPPSGVSCMGRNSLSKFVSHNPIGSGCRQNS